MDKNAIKKHHFWVLGGLAPVLTLVAVLLLWMSVGSAIETENKKIDEANKMLSTRGPGTKVLEEYDVQTKLLTAKKDELWKDNWNRQAVTEKLFAWPQDNDPRQRLKTLEKRHPDFGMPIVDTDEALDVFKRKEVYEAAYDQAALIVKPTHFLGGNWRNVLRYVSNWGVKKPTSDQVWLALEDLWLQRALLKPVAAVNELAADFVPVPPRAGTAADPFHRIFRNKVWEIEIWIENGGADNILRAKLTNLTDRLQLLGTGNTMRLKVWLSDLPTAQPVDFRIEGEFVPAGGTIETKPVPRLHSIPPGTQKEKIARVRQVLDYQTVPIRRIDKLVLGAMDERTFLANQAAGGLKPPLFIKEEPPPAAGVGGDPGAIGAPGAGGAVEIPMRPIFGPETGINPTPTGTPEEILDKNKKRYLAATSQVRRMPFGVVVVVDQMFMQDVMVAYANSPLRCQITGFEWVRFRSTLSNPTPAGISDPMSPEGDVDVETYTLPPMGRFPPVPGGRFAPATPTASTVSEGQVTSGLVQLTLYGVMSIYEKFDPKKTAESGDGTTPATTDPMMPDPMMPMDGTASP